MSQCHAYMCIQAADAFMICSSAETESVFANIVVLLQSCYTGGQVHVSHESSTQSFDLASSSLLSTCVLSWYTGAIHEMKPITSGYRLALTYNVVLTADIPRPRLPNVERAISHLRHVLRKWTQGKYPEDSHIKIMAYLFKHIHTEDALTLDAYRSQDDHKVSQLRPIAAELGYTVGFANLEYRLTGFAADTGQEGGEGDRGDNEDDIPSMAAITKSTLSINDLAALNDGQNVGVDEICLKDENLIPMHPFDDVTPEEIEYEGKVSFLPIIIIPSCFERHF